MNKSELTDRSLAIAIKPITTTPKCSDRCRWIYVGDQRWRCENCLHYLGAKRVQAGLFE